MFLPQRQICPITSSSDLHECEHSKQHNLTSHNCSCNVNYVRPTSRISAAEPCWLSLQDFCCSSQNPSQIMCLKHITRVGHFARVPCVAPVITTRKSLRDGHFVWDTPLYAHFQLTWPRLLFTCCSL